MLEEPLPYNVCIEVLCGDAAYLLFSHFSFYVSPGHAMDGSAVAGCSG